MSEPHDPPQPKSIWRVLKFILPLLFLFIGFFGVQIWMVWDEQNSVKPDKPISVESKAATVKADLAKLAEPSKATPLETPITLTKPAVDNEQAITSGIPGISYYRLQVGSFKEAQGAEKLKKKLQEMGYGSLTVKNTERSEVFTMIFFSQDQAAAIQDRLASKGVSGYPEKVTVPMRGIMLQGDSERLQGFMDGSLIEVPELLRELCDTYYIYESQGLDASAHSAFLLQQISRVSDLKTRVENMQVSPADQALQTELKDYLAGYLKYLESAKKVKTLDRKSLWPGLLERIESFAALGKSITAN